jgi:hypothetical protein
MTTLSGLQPKATTALAILAFALLGASPAFAQVPLGTATSFAVLGGSTVTNTGPTIVTGDLGVHPGAAIVGFPPGTVTGTTHAADAVALQAQTDATTAYNYLAGETCDTVLTGIDLGGLILTPGVYCFAVGAQLTGTLTLNGQGNPNAEFIFQTGSTLITASNASVILTNAAQACNVWWQVGSSATLGTATTFVGTIIALAAVTLDTGATMFGRTIARTAAVTLDTNEVSAGSACAPAGASAIPTLSEWAMLLLATLMAFGAFAVMRRRA